MTRGLKQNMDRGWANDLEIREKFVLAIAVDATIDVMQLSGLDTLFPLFGYCY